VIIIIFMTYRDERHQLDI